MHESPGDGVAADAGRSRFTNSAPALCGDCRAAGPTASSRATARRHRPCATCMSRGLTSAETWNGWPASRLGNLTKNTRVATILGIDSGNPEAMTQATDGYQIELLSPNDYSRFCRRPPPVAVILRDWCRSAASSAYPMARANSSSAACCPSTNQRQRLVLDLPADETGPLSALPCGPAWPAPPCLTGQGAVFRGAAAGIDFSGFLVSIRRRTEVLRLQRRDYFRLPSRRFQTP